MEIKSQKPTTNTSVDNINTSIVLPEEDRLEYPEPCYSILTEEEINNWLVWESGF